MTGSTAPRWERGPRRTGILDQLAAVCRNWHFFVFLMRYNVKNAYQRAILGILWLFIRPLVMVIVATLLVRDTLGLGDDMPVPYPLYVLAGLSCFILFSRGVAWQTRLLYKLKRIMAACYVPRLVHYYSTLSPVLVEYLVVLFCFWLGLAWYAATTGAFHLAPLGQIAMVLPALILIVLWSQVITLVSCVLQLYAKDTWYTLRYALTVLMLITPILYPLSDVPEGLVQYVFLNPLAAPVLMYQWALLDIGEPHWFAFFASAGVAAVLYCVSLKFFVSWESQALDEYI